MTCTPEISRHGISKPGCISASTRVSETHIFLELERLIHLTGEPLDEEATFTVSSALAGLELENGIHRVLEQLDGDLQWHELSLLDVRSDKVAELRIWVDLFGAQEIASGEVRKVALLDEKAALCPFS